jgi:hypothetical protein
MRGGWALATARGTSNLRDNSECQDTSRCLTLGPRKDVLLAVVSDGAGSAKLGKQGSALTCRTITEIARNHFANSDVSPTDEDLWDWVDQCRERINLASQLRQATPRDFSATLVALLALPDETITLHIGDGAAVINTDGQWLVPSWPAHGEYASMTYFITDDPSADLKITRLPYRIDAAAVFSDGIERLVLKFVDQTASASFFDKFATTVRTIKTPGCTAQLNASLKQYLDSPTINERTDDDKSLIIAVRQ